MHDGPAENFCRPFMQQINLKSAYPGTPGIRHSLKMQLNDYAVKYPLECMLDTGEPASNLIRIDKNYAERIQ